MKPEDLQELANQICKNVPEGYSLSINFESGYAGVELIKFGGKFIELPDTSGRTLYEQLNDALCVANGWDIK